MKIQTQAGVIDTVNYLDISDFLSQQLREHFPEECVELGENWEVIATIFYNAGIRSMVEPKDELC